MTPFPFRRMYCRKGEFSTGFVLSPLPAILEHRVKDSIQPVFVEAVGEDWARERESLLSQKISDLGLKLEGTRLEQIVNRLYEDLNAAGIRFRPQIYLADEWGCPEAIPIIGVPFYLADVRLSRLETEMAGEIEAESDEEIVRYLRHEAGHAFNYAYKLYETEEWHKIFGPYSRPYRERYKPNPFSRNYVRHIPGWYAQKHPDEDFAETFAIFIAPDSNWQELYKEWGCYNKLLYVEKVVRQWGQQEPKVTAENFDTSEDLRSSVAEHYRKYRFEPVQMPAYFDGDLKDIFERKLPAGKEDSWTTAHDFLKTQHRKLVRTIHYWTGLDDTLVRSLCLHLQERCKLLQLWSNPEKSTQRLIEISAYVTALCMNKLYRGDFVIK
ncbi:MAG: hypothetical protein C5B54_01285 [Acidobacteria bacterium]|nr:MAG: hypothetical protein C5B54_01285 [Acidobacteriota bacterium]